MAAYLRHAWTEHVCLLQIPLAQTVPFFRLPWVFTYNSWSTKYDYMLKASVRSAMLKAPLLRPICLFSGDPRNAKLYSWLLSQHVKIIHHDPAWKDAFTEKLKGTNNLRHSHLYATADMQVKPLAALQAACSLLSISQPVNTCAR